jgi:hypothetical protein
MRRRLAHALAAELCPPAAFVSAATARIMLPLDDERLLKSWQGHKRAEARNEFRIAQIDRGTRIFY